uniref:Uncharacterized protein n=1 Tax=Oryza glumipatula TaxID=40148 RepID=A0A0D9YY91_9ORYZ
MSRREGWEVLICAPASSLYQVELTWLESYVRGDPTPEAPNSPRQERPGVRSGLAEAESRGKNRRRLPWRLRLPPRRHSAALRHRLRRTPDSNLPIAPSAPPPPHHMPGSTAS